MQNRPVNPQSKQKARRDDDLYENIDFSTPTVTSGSTSLYVDSLTKTFGSGGNAVTAIKNVSFTANSGEVLGLLGPNGAGKTTTIKSILGLVLPDSGTVRIRGIDPYDEPRKAYRHVDAMFEGARNDYWRLTVMENLRYFAAVRGQNPDSLTGRHEALLERLDILDKADTQVRDLSRGMKQKVSLASILAADVSIAFLDEPTLGLDVETTLKLRREISQLTKESDITILLSSHDMDVVESVCDRVIIMSNGQIVVNDDVDNLLAGFATKGYRFIIREINDNILSTLNSNFNITDVERKNGRARFGVSVDSDGFYNLTNVMESNGVEIVNVESTQPDLENVFVEITNSNDSGTPPQVNNY